MNNDEWSPPANPDPGEILDEVRADRRMKRYKTALAKHVWFHENALSIEPGFYGVRLSFALSYWHELANEYPPALTKLIEFRDQAKQNVIDGQDVRSSFHDMISINRQLEELSETQKFFEFLDETNPEAARQVFRLALPALVQRKAYSLLGKYVVPNNDFATQCLDYQHNKKIAPDPRIGPHHLEYANKRFANSATTLVAILAVNNRQEEAEQIATSARAEWDDSSFHAGLDNALNGIFPER